eukprot:IDg8408t1
MSYLPAGEYEHHPQHYLDHDRAGATGCSQACDRRDRRHLWWYLGWPEALTGMKSTRADSTANVSEYCPVWCYPESLD